MKKLVELQKKIIPEILSTMEKRYMILREISLQEPVGRRTLANRMGIGERIIRSEVEFLKEQELISIQTSGMSITEEGTNVLESLREFISEIRGISKMEETLKERLGIRKVIIVPGDADEDEYVVGEIGKVAGKYFLEILQDNSVVGITGGTTMDGFAKALPNSKKYKDLLIVPARGGLGEEVEIQANTIVGMLGKKLNSNYRLLHVPDNLNKDIVSSMMSQPEIKETMDLISAIDTLIFGIGRADEMAKRRKVSDDEMDIIEDSKAVAEAFGHYFNQEGNTVHETSTVGIKPEDFKSVKNAIGIAGGKRKADAIMAISKIKEDLVLITDEGAAQYILKVTDSIKK